MTKVASSDMQKNFGAWLDRVHEGPIEITKYNRSSSFLVSAKLFHDLMASYRKAMPAAGIDDELMAQIRAAKVETDAPYALDDLPDSEPSSNC